MLTLTILKSVWLPWLIKQKISAYAALFLFGRKFLIWFGWLSGVWTQIGILSENSGAYVRPPRLGMGVRAVPRLCIELCPGIYLTTEENHGETSVRAAKKCLANHCRARFVWSTWPLASGGLDWSAGTRHSLFTLRGTRRTLGQSRYLPSCRTKGSPTIANLESKLAVRALIGSAKKGTPKSSWICLLLRYQSGIRNKAKTLGL